MVRILSTPLTIVVGLVMVAAALGLFSISTAEGGPPEQPPYPTVCPCAAEVSVGAGTVLTDECVSVAVRTTKNGEANGGVVCKMSVIGPPGTGAYVDPEEVTTDENGEANVVLCGASIPGSYVVKAETDCCGSEGQLKVESLGSSTQQTPLPTPTKLPETGVGTGRDSSSSMPLLAIWSAIALGALAAGSVLAWQIGGWRSRGS
jgi:hypothetical protein